MKRATSLTLVFVLCRLVYAGAIEEWVEAAPDPEGVQEWLDELREHPLDLNRASCEALARLPFFDDKTVRTILDARAAKGGFGSLADIDTIQNLSAEQREVLYRFTIVRPLIPDRARMSVSSQAQDDVRTTVRASFRSGTNANGYVRAKQAATPMGPKDVVIGLEYADVESRWRMLIGNFQCESGTGLVFGSAFGAANWISQPDNLVISDPQGLRLRPASNRLSLYRGMGCEVERGGVKATILASDQGLDAATSEQGVERITEGETSSDELEHARADQVEERLVGGAIEINRRDWQIAINGYRSHFDPGFNPDPSLTNPNQFQGSELQVGSGSAHGMIGNLELTIEAAKSDPGAWAHQLMISVVEEHLRFAAYQILAASDFYSPHSQVWAGYGESAANERRTGARFQIRAGRLTTTLNAWSSQTPFRTATSVLRHATDGVDWRASFPLTSTINAALLAGRTWNEESSTGLIDVTDRGKAEVTLTTPLEFKLRLDVRSVQLAGNNDAKLGSMLSLQTKYMAFLTTIRFQISLYDVESSDVAMRAYENTLQGLYPIVTMYHSGRRVSLMASRKLGPIRAALKVAQTAQEINGEQTSSSESAMQLSLEW